MDPAISPEQINIQGPGMRPLHCFVAMHPNGGLTIRPADWDTPVWLNNNPITTPSHLQSGVIIKMSPELLFRFIDPQAEQVSWTESMIWRCTKIGRDNKEWRKASAVMKTKTKTVETRFNKPLFNENSAITNLVYGP